VIRAFSSSGSFEERDEVLRSGNVFFTKGASSLLVLCSVLLAEREAHEEHHQWVTANDPANFKTFE